MVTPNDTDETSSKPATSSRTRWKHRVEATKNSLEIIAILVAGGWALWMYVLKDRPTLKPRISVDVTLGWAEERDRCIASATFAVQNTGSTDLQVKGSTLQAYAVTSDAFPPSPMT